MMYAEVRQTGAADAQMLAKSIRTPTSSAVMALLSLLSISAIVLAKSSGALSLLHSSSRVLTYRLNDGNQMPVIGLGVFRVPPGEKTYESVRNALAMGYRHIDTAQLYANEEAVGRAVRNSGIPRSKLWVTTKISTVFSSAVTYDETIATLNKSLAKLGLDYVDLYLIHSPRDKKNRRDQWRALIHAKQLGLVRSIGVSDYEVAQLEEIIDTEIPPAVLQIELSPWLTQVRAAELAFCKEHGIIIETWGLMGAGKILQSPELQGIAKAESKGRATISTAEVLVLWSLQRGYIPLVTSQNVAHQRSNLAVVQQDWKLSDASMEVLDTISRREKPFFSVGNDISGDERHPPP